MSSLMARETAEIPTVVRQQLTHNAACLQRLGAELRAQPPRAVMMIGRGTSDHAGVFAKYLIEVECGVPVMAAAPSIASVYGQTLRLDGMLAICISQSGKSPDIVAQAERAKAGGARVLALVNNVDSPLAAVADDVLPLHAGPELAVAATKSYIASLVALVSLVAAWQDNADLQQALQELPQQLQNTPAQAFALADFQQLKQCVVLGRGFGYAIAREMALKLKEVLSIQAEAFSSAEFLHGPVTLVEQHLTVVNCQIDDEGAAYHQAQIADVAARGAHIVPFLAAGALHPRLQPIALMQQFYQALEQLAVQQGLNPDAPPGLKKVTETR
ncbi:glucosamine-6-phosphate deaminase NagB-II [Pseudidiomarina sp. YC-516-91]|uniref:glucosamine-6-phosphate deaminase NagB-II n=1 Tax=Pseudidiomarina salilacus TaxID=3384452 RepID=UPI0039848F32